MVNVVRACGECLYWWSARDDDTSEIRFRKKVLVLVTLVSTLLNVFCVVSNLNRSNFGVFNGGVGLAYSLTLLVCLRFIKTEYLQHYVLAVVGLWLFAVLTADLNGAVYFQRYWAVLVIVVDVLLVLRAPPFVAKTVVAVASVHIVVTSCEQHLRLGLFDLPAMVSYSERAESCECERPPCPLRPQTAYGSMITALCVFLLDFYMTRGFAYSLDQEKAKIEASVSAAAQVADALASFDLEAAEVFLDARKGDMPPKLSESMRRILSHLREYKPYLPQAVLFHEEELLSPESRSFSSILTTSTRASTASVVTKPLDVPESNPQLELKRVHMSMVTLSAKAGSCSRLFLSAHCEFLAHVVDRVAECKGIIDTFTADRVVVSFNAARTCPQHALSAVRSAQNSLGFSTQLPSWTLTGGIASGRAHAGIIGVSGLRRHTTAGVLPMLADGLERTARVLHCTLLCSERTSMDVSHAVQTRALLHRGVFDVEESNAFSQGGEAASETNALYEVLDGVVRSPKGRSGERAAEWMYELEMDGEWATYNVAAKAYLSGRVAEALQQLEDADNTELAGQLREDARVACMVDLTPTLRPCVNGFTIHA